MQVKSLADVQTPALVLDKIKLQANIDRMAAHARGLKVALRPHLKTPKSEQVAKLLLDAGAQGFNVSTLKEAEYFYAAGINDLYYCVPFAPNKAARAMALAAAGCQLTLMTDSLEGTLAAISAIKFAKKTIKKTATENVLLDFTLEIDVDGYRSGLPFANPDIIAAAQALNNSGVTRFKGIMSYAGASYTKTPDQTWQLTQDHLHALAQTKADLVEAGLPCEMVSLGSTPALLHAQHVDGVTEARCGIYIFQDLFQAGIGACGIEDIALSVIASVIGRQPHNNRLVIDAGGLALSKDRSTAGKPFDALYGWVCDATTGERIDDMLVSAVSQELGLVTTQSGAPVDMDRFPVGSFIRILPNHADMTAAAYESYWVVAGSDQIEAAWGRTNHWEAS